MTEIMTALVEAPTRFQKYWDSCTCGRTDKAAINSIKMELEAKDSAIERLEEEIRRKDSEKEDLIYMQKDLQSQIEEIRRVLEEHANDSMKMLPEPIPNQLGMGEERAAVMMQTRARGIHGRKRVQQVREERSVMANTSQKEIVRMQAAARGKQGRKLVDNRLHSAAYVQARVRGKSARRLVEKRAAAGDLPAQRVGRLPPLVPEAAGASASPEQLTPPPQQAPLPPQQAPPPQQPPQQSINQSMSSPPLQQPSPPIAQLHQQPPQPPQPVAIGRVVASNEPLGAAATNLDEFDDEDDLYTEDSTVRERTEGTWEDESVDSDYDYDESAFADLGLELLAGKLKLAKVYGQEEPPAAEDELEWELRYFVLFDNGRMCHFDEMQDGLPVGDRGLIDLKSIKSVEKVLGVPTFVMKCTGKVYLFKLEPHDEVMMRTWIAAISQELAA